LSLKGLDVKRLFLISGIGGIIAGILGVVAFVWDYYDSLFYTQMEDIAFIILSLIVILTGIFVLRSKRSVILDITSSRYAGSYWN
jgi:predicted transporter